MALKAGYKHSEVGVIPEDWEVKTLLELAEGKKELFDDGDWIEAEHMVFPPFRAVLKSRSYAAMANFWIGVIPPSAMLGRS